MAVRFVISGVSASIATLHNRTPSVAQCLRDGQRIVAEQNHRPFRTPRDRGSPLRYRRAMELRTLGYFATTCLQPSLHRSSAALGLAASTLSASLRGLEEAFGVPLFRRSGAGLEPLPAARWLYQTACPLLHAEAFARRHAGVADSASSEEVAAPERLAVVVEPEFSFGRITKALSGAIEQLASTAVFVEPVWPSTGLAAEADDSAVVIRYGQGTAAGEMLLFEDPLVLVRTVPDASAAPAFADLLRGRLLVPALPDPLPRLIRDALGERQVEVVAEGPLALPRLAAERRDAVIVVPASLVSHRLGLPSFQALPLDPPAAAPVVACVPAALSDKAAPVAAALVALLRARLLAADGAGPVFRPVLTLRGLRVFETLDRVRGVTAAARGLGVAQPAVTEALRRLEAALGGTRLFGRGRAGLDPTAAGRRLRAAAPAVQRLQNRLGTGRAAATAPEGRSGRLRLGLVPSAGPADPLALAVAAAVAAWENEGWHLALEEAPAVTLAAALQEGRLDLAVVDWASAHALRLPLQPPEPLAVLAPADWRLPAEGVTIGELARLRLALPGPAHGLRRALDAAARPNGAPALRPTVEVSAPSVAVALARRGAFATVLPAVAAAALSREGAAACVPLLGDPAPTRQLLAVHAGDRELTTAERGFLGFLRQALRPAVAGGTQVEVAHPT